MEKKISVKVVVFEHPKYLEKDRFCCACKAICLFSSGFSYTDARQKIEDTLKEYLKDKEYSRLLKMGWRVLENSITPPIFTDEEIIEYASSYFRMKIVDYQIVELNVSINGTED